MYRHITNRIGLNEMTFETSLSYASLTLKVALVNAVPSRYVDFYLFTVIVVKIHTSMSREIALLVNKMSDRNYQF